MHILYACVWVTIWVYGAFIGDGNFHRNSPKALIKTDVKLAYEYVCLQRKHKFFVTVFLMTCFAWLWHKFHESKCFLLFHTHFTILHRYVHVISYFLSPKLCIERTSKALRDLNFKWEAFFCNERVSKFRTFIKEHRRGGFNIVNFIANSPINYFNYSQACSIF